MKSLEEFLAERNSLVARAAAFTPAPEKCTSTLHLEVRQAANRGLALFPVPESLRLMGQTEFLIGEATSNISHLEQLAAEYPACSWRVALTPSKLCVLRVDGPQGRASLAALSKDEEDSLTLQVRRGDRIWALFRRPEGLNMRASAKRLAPGVTVLAEEDICPVPPSGGCTWLNPRAEIEGLPHWLRDLLFESPDDSSGKSLHVPTPFPRPAACRHAARFDRQPKRAQHGHSTCNQAGCRGGFRVSRRR